MIFIKNLKIYNIKKIFFSSLIGITLLGTCSCENNKTIYTISSNNKDENNKDNDENNIDKYSNEEEKFILNFFEEQIGKISKLEKSDSINDIKEKSKEIFLTTTDFIFKDGEINGITFDELSDSCKEKVLIIMEKIDVKIEKLIPNYKETIKDKSGKSYSYIKENLSSKKEEIKSKYIDKFGEENYEEIIEKKDEVKDIYNKVKEKTKEKIKNYTNK